MYTSIIYESDAWLLTHSGFNLQTSQNSARFIDVYAILKLFALLVPNVQPNFKGSNTLGTMKYVRDMGSSS